MKRVEGVHASYVGPSKGSLNRGDRCFIMSDEGTVMHVRWVTGASAGEYGQMRPAHLVADRPVEDPGDAFAFEAVAPPSRVAVNVSAVYQHGGEVALFEALESMGHFSTLKEAAIEAVASVRARLEHDPAWRDIVAMLGTNGGEVERSAILAAISGAVEMGGSDGDDAALEDDALFE